MAKTITAGVALLDNGRIWLVKDSHGVWGIPKGKRDSCDDTAYDAAVREVSEELSADAFNATWLCQAKTISGRPLIVYASIGQHKPMINDTQEIKRVKLVSLKRAAKLMPRGQRTIIKALRGSN